MLETSQIRHLQRTLAQDQNTIVKSLPYRSMPQASYFDANVSYRIQPIIKGTHAPCGTFFSAAIQKIPIIEKVSLTF